MNADILHQDVQNLLEFFAKNCYKANDNSTNANEVLQKCSVLMKIDYNVVEISNNLGELSSHYPSTILIPEYEFHNFNNPVNNLTTNRQQTIYESIYDANKLRDLIGKARFARCRARFPLPIILYRGKYICRSATLSGGPEIYTRSGFDYLFCGVDNTTVKSQTVLDEDAYEAQESSLNQDESFSEEKNWQLFDRVRSQDIKLLKTLNVGTIIDFMVEKKKVKFLMNVTSSEKVDKEKRYQDFRIISLPYPGCEFFREFRDNNYSGDGLVFDWSHKSVDAEIGVPEDGISSLLNIDWEKYKNWDLVQITQNYMKLMLKYLHDSSSGLLIHCISGWDRTPLFISLLRLSLWADGLIHQSLNAIQILYFTIAYDWFLFGHNLPDRLQKGEEIFFFCFYVLKYLMDDEFSIAGQRFRSSKQSSSGSSSIGVIRTDSDVFDGILFDGDSRGSSISLNSTCSARSQQDHNVTASSNGIHDDNNANGWIHNQDGNNSFACFSSNDSATNILNFSPQLQRRTSPMTVPKISGATNENKNHRQRQESSSSVSVGSWQMISGTGSLRSQDSNIIVVNEHHQSVNNQNNNNNTSVSNTPSTINQANPNMCSNQQNTNLNLMSSNGLINENNTIVDDDCFTANDYFMRRERLNSVRTLFYNCYSSTIGYKFRNGPDSATLGSLLGNFAEKLLETPEDSNSYDPIMHSGELEIARVNNVCLTVGQKIKAKRSTKCSSKNLKGLLILTNFRICFSVFGDKNKTTMKSSQHQQNNFLSKFDITLSNIDELYICVDDKQKLLIPNQKTVQKIDAIRIVCKNFRMMTFDFSENSEERGKYIADTLLELAFPTKHTLLFMYNFREKYYNTSRKIKTFNNEIDWINELQRCGMSSLKIGWRIFQRNLPGKNDALPKSFVIPEQYTNDQYLNFCKLFQRNRGLFWVWGMKNGASIMRMADFMFEPSINQRDKFNLKDKKEFLSEELNSVLNKQSPSIIALADYLPSLQDIHQSYIRLRKLCTPTSDRELMIQDEKYLTHLEKTSWLLNVSLCIKTATTCAQTLINGQSIVLQEFEGRDMSCVVSSLIQILLDPHYRTIYGFQELIQKDWVALGHAFSHRLGHVYSTNAEKSPIFLLFLDCVWQILQQFPEYFEYSETFLTTIWDCAFIPIFDTFQFNSEYDRLNAIQNHSLILRPVWDWEEMLNEKDIALFFNPFCNKSEINKETYLSPSHYIWDLEIFSQCYYRFMPILEILNGGLVQVELFNRLTARLQNIKNTESPQIPSINSFFPFSYFNQSDTDFSNFNEILLRSQSSEESFDFDS